MLLNRRWTEEVHTVAGIAPIAAIMATQTSIYVNMSLWKKCVFTLFTGVGTTGTATLTVNAATSAAGANAVAIPFTYRSYATELTTDVPTTVPTLATSAGFTTTAGSNGLYVLEVDAANLNSITPIAGSPYKYVSMTLTNVVSSNVIGGVLIQLSNPAYQGALAPTTVIV